MRHCPQCKRRGLSIYQIYSKLTGRPSPIACRNCGSQWLLDPEYKILVFAVVAGGSLAAVLLEWGFRFGLLSLSVLKILGSAFILQLVLTVLALALKYPLIKVKGLPVTARSGILKTISERSPESFDTRDPDKIAGIYRNQFSDDHIAAQIEELWEKCRFKPLDGKFFLMPQDFYAIKEPEEKVLYLARRHGLPYEIDVFLQPNLDLEKHKVAGICLFPAKFGKKGSIVAETKPVITLEQKHVHETERLAGTISHEIAHLYLFFHDLLLADSIGNEMRTDLATFAMGLGLLTLKRHVKFWQGGRKNRDSWLNSGEAYLNGRQMLIAHKKILAHLRESREEAWPHRS